MLGIENVSKCCWKDATTSSIYKSLNIDIPYVAHWEKVLSINDGGKTKFDAVGAAAILNSINDAFIGHFEGGIMAAIQTAGQNTMTLKSIQPSKALMGKAFKTIQHRDDHMHSHSRLNSVCCLSALWQFLKFTTVPHFIRLHRHKYRGPRILAALQTRQDCLQYKTFTHFFSYTSQSIPNMSHTILCHTNVLH